LPPRGRGAARLGDAERGQATVEFALVLPVPLTVLFAIFELGTAFGDYIEVSAAARGGARAASVSRLQTEPGPAGCRRGARLCRRRRPEPAQRRGRLDVDAG
jgi:hypothetical protein